MSLSISSLSQSVGVQSSTPVADAVLAKSLDAERQEGAEAVDLIQSAAALGDTSGRMLSVYA